MRTISHQELKQKIDGNEDMELIEVLPEDSYEEFHLPKAKNIPFDDDFPQKIKRQVPDKNKQIVVYCANSHCPLSDDAYNKLDEMGYKNVFEYQGGKEDWKAAGYPIET